MQAEKTLPNARVKRRVLLEPLIRLRLLEPELQDVPNPPIFRIIDERDFQRIEKYRRAIDLIDRLSA